MDAEKKIIFANYISHLCLSNKTTGCIGKYVRHIKIFLDSGYELTRKGYESYKKNNAEIHCGNSAKEAILDLLHFLGVGYRRKKRQDNVIPLEKLSMMSSRNEKLLGEFMDWLDEKHDYSENTMAIYHNGIKSFFEYSNEFTAENAKRFIKALDVKGYSPTTLRLKILALEKFGKYIRKPIELNRPKYRKSLDTENVPTEEEYKRLLSFLRKKKNGDYYFFIKILAMTGARVSEFFQFTWENILDGEVVLKGKGNKYRRFFFPISLQKEVSDYVKKNGKKGLVAVGRQGPLTQRGLSQVMKVWGKRVCIDKKKMHPHAFRHFFAKMYLKNSKDVVQLAEFLGHSSVDITRIYLQRSRQEQMNDINYNVNW